MSKHRTKKRVSNVGHLETLNARQYIVAFLDVLGMRDELRKLDHDPVDGSVDGQSKKLIEAVKNSMMAIETFFRLYESFAEAFRTAPSANIPGISECDAARIEHARRAKIEQRVFGDTLLLYFPVSHQDDHSPISALYAVVVASAALCLLQLGRKHPIRGG